MKLKDKKIEMQESRYVTDEYGNQVKQTVIIATVWAYFRKLSGDEIYRGDDADRRNRYVPYQLPLRHNNIAHHKVQRFLV